MQRGIHWIMSVSILLWNISQVHTQSCNEPVDIRRIRLEPSPFRDTYTLFPDNTSCFQDHSQLNCISPSTLNDDIIGPERPDLFMEGEIDRLKFVVWPKDTSAPYISIEPVSAATIYLIDLYIYNYPAKGFSLPNIGLYGTSNATVINPPPESSLEFDLINNDNLSQNDISILRKVTLRLRELTTVTVLLIRWNSTGLFNVDYFGLSELIVHCGENFLSEYNTQSISFLAPEMHITTIVPKTEFLTNKSLVLICTVSAQGSFEWGWKNGSVNIVESPTESLFTADGTRTSILKISQLNFADAGLYLCEARFSGVSDAYSRLFNITFPKFIKGSPSIEALVADGSVKIPCEVYGYFTNPIIITWVKEGCTEKLTNSSKYSITSNTGKHQLIFSNKVAGLSVVSSLTIMQLSKQDQANYTCSTEGMQSTSEILILRTTAVQTNQIRAPYCHLIAAEQRNVSSDAVTNVLGAGKEGFLALSIFALLY